MPEHPPEDDVEVEIVCRRCGYRTTRTAARLRREIKIVCPQCGADIVPGRSDGGSGAG